MRKDEPISSAAIVYADKMFSCVAPCDSFGVCEGCCERTIFLSGYNFGYRAAKTLSEPGEQKEIKMTEQWKQIAKEFGYGMEIDYNRSVNAMIDEILKLREERNRFKELYEDYSQEVDELQLEINESRTLCVRLDEDLKKASRQIDGLIASAQNCSEFSAANARLRAALEYYLELDDITAVTAKLALATTDGKAELEAVKKILPVLDKYIVPFYEDNPSDYLRTAFGLGE